MGAVVQHLRRGRKSVGDHRRQTLLVAVGQCGVVVPALELDHGERLAHARDVRLGLSLARLEQLLARGVGGRPLLYHGHELFDLLDLEPRLLEALDHAKQLELVLPEATRVARALQVGKQALFIVVAQRGDRDVEHGGHLADRVHEQLELVLPEATRVARALQVGKQALFIVVAQRGDRDVEHGGHLADRVHGSTSGRFLQNLA